MGTNPEVARHPYNDTNEFFPIVGMGPDGKLYPIAVKPGGGLEIEVAVGGIEVELDPDNDGVSVYGWDGSANAQFQLIPVGTSKALKVFEISPPDFQRLQTDFVWAALNTTFQQDDSSTEVDVGVAGLGTNRFNELTLEVDYTTSGSATGLEIIFDFSADASAWAQECAQTDAGSAPVVRSHDVVVHSLPPTTDVYRYSIPLNDGYYRIRAREVGTGGGTLTIRAIAGRK